MRVLFLTWEFPPLIAGGLGVACHGMAKSLLKAGTEIDLLLPTDHSVYFPLRSPADADNLPVRAAVPLAKKSRPWQQAATALDRLKLLGLSKTPETYLSLKGSPASPTAASASLGGSRATRVMRVLNAEDSPARGLFGKVHRFAAQTVADYARRHDFDVIHAHDWLSYPAGLVAREMSGRPLLAHMHATEFDRAGGPGNQSVHRIEYLGLKYADLAVAVSNYTANLVKDRYLVPSDHIRVVHNAHSTQPRDDKIKRRLFTDALIVFLGRITIQKGPDYFLALAQKVLARHPRVHFVMAGDGDLRRQMIHKAAFLRLKHHFLFTNFLNLQEVNRLLEAADIFIMPSVSEPFGIVPLEAMAHKVAVIISKQSGVSEVVRNACKVDFWDVDQTVAQVCRLIEKPAQRKRMGEAGYKEVCALSWDEPAVKINRAYQQLLNLQRRTMPPWAAAA